QKAEETYRYVLSVDPTDASALEQLDRTYTSMEQHGELAAIIEQRVRTSAADIEQVELYTRLGQTYEERLAQVDDAIRAYRKIFDELDKTYEVAIQALERLYTQKGAWNDVKVVLDRELENASGDSAEADIRAKIVHLLADRLGDVNGAVEMWMRVLDLRGEDPEALHGLADLYER